MVASSGLYEPVRQLRAMARYGHLIRNLVARDLDLKYKGTVLGFIWSLANPLLMLVVYTLVFRHVLRVQIEDFELFFFVGYLSWRFFVTSVTAGTGCVVGSRSLLAKIWFPRLVLPTCVILSSAVQFILAAVAFAPMLWLFGLRISPALLALPAAFVLQMIFAWGAASFLAAAYTYYRDTRHLLDVLLAAWFWVTPIVYMPEAVPGWMKPVIAANPVAAYIEAYRTITMEAGLPSLATTMAMIMWAGLAGILGVSFYCRRSPAFVEHT